VRAFLRRTVEGCQRLADLDHGYNLRSSVRHGAVTAAVTETDLKSLQRSYDFMEKSSFRALMPLVGEQRRPFFRLLSARQLEARCGTAKDVYVGGVVDRFGGSFRPRKLVGGLGRALQKRGVRIFQETEAEAIELSDGQISVFCSNGAHVQAGQVFMANAYARHINPEVFERSIFSYDYVVVIDFPDGAQTLASASVLSDTRDPCFYARRHGSRLYMGYEETPETSEKITRQVARRTLAEAQRIFPELRAFGEGNIKSAWSGRVYYTLDDYPFVERALEGRLTTFAAPSDHGNALAAKVGQLVGDLAADAIPSQLPHLLQSTLQCHNASLLWYGAAANRFRADHPLACRRPALAHDFGEALPPARIPRTPPEVLLGLRVRTCPHVCHQEDGRKQPREGSRNERG
jgi:glycine/D-amino acid oxidase-like deaminating enzyme